jgi:prophage regulatory protein
VTELPKQIRLQRRREVLAATGLSQTRLYILMAEGNFPRPIKIGGRAVAWAQHEVDGWIRDRYERSRASVA